MGKDSNGNERAIDFSKKRIDLWEYNFHGHKSYYDPNHNIMFGRKGYDLYKEEFGDRLNIIKKETETDKNILRQSTSLLPRTDDLSRELFKRRKWRK